MKGDMEIQSAFYLAVGLIMAFLLIAAVVVIITGTLNVDIAYGA